MANPATEVQDEIVRSISLRAPIQKVWDAIINPRKFGEWFRCEVSGEFKVGAIVNCRSTYHQVEDEPVHWQKKIVAIESERYFAFTWSPGPTGADQHSEDQSTTVEFRLQASSSSSTQLEIRESGFAGLPDAWREHSFRSNTQGWDGQVENITAYVE